MQDGKRKSKKGDKNQMKWNKFRLQTTTRAEDVVSSILTDLGIEGV